MAITYVTNQGGSSAGTGAVSFAMPGPVAVGDLLVAMLAWAGTTADVTPTISDNLNAGAWNLPASLHFTVLGSNLEIVMAWIRCDTAGTPTVSASSIGAQGANLVVAQYNGFVHAPALVAADITTNNGTSTSIAAAGLTNSVANELTIAFAAFGGGQNMSAPTGSFTTRRAPDAGDFFADIVKATSGNALTFGGTITSAHWGVMLASFQDAVTGGAALAGAASDAVTAVGALATGAAAFAPILLDNPAHVNGSTQVGMGSGAGSGTGDNAFVAFTKLKQWASDINAMTAQLFPVRSVQTPITGFTLAVSQGVTQLILNPAGTLASGSFTLPILPADNQPFTVMTSQTITALAVNTSDGTTLYGAPTTMAPNSPSVKWRFQVALNAWVRE